MEEIWKEQGRREARKDYEKHKAGEITKEQLLAGCDYSRYCAAWGDEEAQAKGYGYLLEMEAQGIIKRLRRVD